MPTLLVLKNCAMMICLQLLGSILKQGRLSSLSCSLFLFLLNC
jgi:hypothetical protein